VTAKQKTVTTEAVRDAVKMDKARLQLALSTERCRHCGQTGAWIIYKVDGQVRYVKCRGCTRNSKVIVKRDAIELEEQLSEQEGAELRNLQDGKGQESEGENAEKK